MDERQDDSSWAKLLGGTYAYLQHGMDKVIEWGFAEMRKAADAPAPKKAPKEPENEYIARAKKLAKGAARFASSTVSAYYDTYRDLKKKDGKA